MLYLEVVGEVACAREALDGREVLVAEKGVGALEQLYHVLLSLITEQVVERLLMQLLKGLIQQHQIYRTFV